jgi:S-adenosylmethionine/arginine decarboxylase-like enzyme
LLESTTCILSVSIIKEINIFLTLGKGLKTTILDPESEIAIHCYNKQGVI